jgi:hypothetical protein
MMPKLIRTIDEVKAQEKRDMLFVQFKPSFLERRTPSSSRQHHLEWFDATRLRYERVAPSGWLGGDPGLFAIYFSSLDDPRITDYSAVFENADGKSLAPGNYQMVIVTYQSWLDSQS